MARNVQVTLSLIATGFEAGMAKARASTENLTSALESNERAAGNVGTSMMTGGAAILAGVGLVTKAAMDWESSWAGVTKTVDGSAEQLARLQGELREMARTLPASHTEIAAVAEAAGQLGVATDDVASFTRVMIDLGETTNLSADEAATSIAQMSNVMGTAGADVERLASTLVLLGNNGASTERDIMQMATRLAGAGKLIGASEHQVLALANTMASLGIEAQLGGGVMSRVLQQINSEVLSGGDNLAGFADVAGMSAQQFAAAWKSDPVRALDSFIQGLATVQNAGGDTVSMLKDLGIRGTENMSVLLRLTGAGDLLTDSLKMGADAWSANSALAQEAAQRYETTESKVKAATNSIKDAGITLGSAMLPAVAGLAEGAAGIATAFAAIPAPVQTAGMGLATIAGVGLLVGGGLLKAAIGVRNLRDDFRSLVPAGSAAEGKLAGLGKAAGIAAAAMALLTVGQVVREMTNVTVTTGDAAVALERFAKQGGTLDGMFNGGVFGINNLDDALRTLGQNDGWNKFREGAQDVLGLGGDFIEAKESIASLDEALAGMDAQTAAVAFEMIAKKALEAGWTTETLADQFVKYGARVQEASAAAGESVTSQEALAGALEGVEDAAAGAAGTMRELGNQMLALSGSRIAFEASLDSAAEAIGKYGRASLDASGQIDINSASGQALQKALDGVAASALTTLDNMDKTNASAEEMAKFQSRAADEFLKTAGAMGVSAAVAAEMAADYGLIPRDVATAVSAPGAELSAEQARNLVAALLAVPKLTEAEILAPGARPAKAEVDAFLESVGTIPGVTEAEIRTLADLYGIEAVKTGLGQIGDKTITVEGNTVPAEKAVSAVLAKIDTGAGTVTINGNQVPAAQAVATVVALANNSKGTVTVDGNNTPAQNSTKAAVTNADRSKGTITVDGNNAPANAATRAATATANNSTGTIRVRADVSAAEAAITHAARNRTTTVTVRTGFVGGGGSGGGGGGGWADGGMLARTGAGLRQFMASGGFAAIGAQAPQIRAAGGAGITWAEHGAGPWEAFVSGHPAKRARSRWILEETARRLGGFVAWGTPYADGGIRFAPGYTPPATLPGTATTVIASPMSRGDMDYLAAQIGRHVLAGADRVAGNHVASNARSIAAAGVPR